MTINVLVGEILTGRITATIPVTSLRWSDVLNGAGSIEVTVTADVVRDFDLRQNSHGTRSFLAVERDGRIKQAGPIWSRTWDWEKGELSLGASGLWSWLDRRVVRGYSLTQPWALNTFAVTGKSLGGLARALVEQAVTYPLGAPPVLLPPDEAGDHTESFPLWSVPWCGEQLRQITQRATDAPDIAFPARRTASSALDLEWVMEVGTADQPALSQAGPEWVFDTTAPNSPVRGISTDEDATQMANKVWLTGNGQEEATLMAEASSIQLLNLGWPILEADESRSTVEEQATLESHADALLARSNRPVEVFKVTVAADAAAEVAPGHYSRVITKGPQRLADGNWTTGDAWLGDMDRVMRIRSVAGDQSDFVTLEMFPVAALL